MTVGSTQPLNDSIDHPALGKSLNGTPGKDLNYRVCTHCVMDTSDPYITFDEHGRCSHCRLYASRATSELHYDKSGQALLTQIVDRIKSAGAGKTYDCIIGMSGGVDSTYVAYVVKQLGLRPLAVHLDNGWNSETAVRNVERALNTLGIDLFTHVINWEEFKDLQLSFLKASVANVEIPTDHAITAILFRIASQQGIRYIIGGSNIVTEGILPRAWGYDHRDWRHIKALHRRFGTVKLRTYPHYTLAHMAYYIFLKHIKFIPILNYVNYNKAEAIKILEQKLGWEYYGGKHYESIFTKFFQAHILPEKFKFDKRRAHLSTLINSEQITRAQALVELAKPLYTPEALRNDLEYVTKKFGLTPKEFEEVMKSPPKDYSAYPSNDWVFTGLPRALRIVKKFATAK